MTKATILIPTHDHGPTLRYAVQSALGQTVQDIEVLIVGDGVPDITREIAADLMNRDDRVRFFDNPKGPRHGEIHRHAALQQATGDIVCYLADDDLWLPTHIESMRNLFADADFGHALPLSISASGAIGGWTIDFAFPYYRDFLLSGSNRIPLSCAAHTLARYRSLPYGWRTTPPDIYTDLYMWQQFLVQPSLRAASGHQPTVLHFPSPWRQDWTIEERVRELEQWQQELKEAQWRRTFQVEVLESVSRERARLEAANDEVVKHLLGENRKLQAESESLRVQLTESINHNATLREELRRLVIENDAARAELTSIYSLPMWRLRNRLLQSPLGASLLKLAGRVLTGPSNR